MRGAFSEERSGFRLSYSKGEQVKCNRIRSYLRSTYDTVVALTSGSFSSPEFDKVAVRFDFIDLPAPVLSIRRLRRGILCCPKVS